MSQQDAPLGHHLDQVTGAEPEGEIPSYAEDDDFPVKVPTLKLKSSCAEAGSVIAGR
jgi:hypothetical protein